MPQYEAIIRNGLLGQVIEVILLHPTSERFSVNVLDKLLYFSPIRQRFIGLFDANISQEALLSEVVITAEASDTNNFLNYGDLDETSSITITDAVIVTQIALGNFNASEKQLLQGDVLNNQMINISDAVEIIQRALGNKSSFPVEDQ